MASHDDHDHDQAPYVATGKGMPGRVWALVGDAAFGLPFFRALNDGLLCATKLAATIADHFELCQRRAAGEAVPGGAQQAHRRQAKRKGKKASSFAVSSVSSVSSVSKLSSHAPSTALQEYASFFASLAWRERATVGTKATVVGSAVSTANASRHVKQKKVRAARRVQQVATGSAASVSNSSSAASTSGAPTRGKKHNCKKTQKEQDKSSCVVM